MITENKNLMIAAKQSLTGKWGKAIGAILIYIAIIIAITVIGIKLPIAKIATYIIAGPFTLGISMLSLAIARGEEFDVDIVFDGFKNFKTSLFAYLAYTLYVLLWLLVLIVPGIIASISYSMTFFIIADDKTTGVFDALDKSKQMMNGYKMKYFKLMLRFLGLGLLCILTLGIGLFWLMPYMYVTTAKFYEDVKQNSISAETISAV